MAPASGPVNWATIPAIKQAIAKAIGLLSPTIRFIAGDYLSQQRDEIQNASDDETDDTSPLDRRSRLSDVAAANARPASTPPIPPVATGNPRPMVSGHGSSIRGKNEPSRSHRTGAAVSTPAKLSGPGARVARRMSILRYGCLTTVAV